MKKNLLSLLVLIFLFTVVVSPATAAPLVFRFAGQSPPNHFTTKYMKEIAKEIKAGTNGRVELVVYPASQLGNYTLLFEEMARGSVDMELGGVPSEFDPRLGMIYICGYITGYDSLKNIFAPGAWLPTKMNALTLPLGVRTLGSYVEGMIGIGSVKPVKEPLNPKVDKGVLTRVATMDVYMVGAKAMGYRPIGIPWPDTYQALQTGVCDAAIGFPTASAYDMLGDVIKYWYATNYSMEIQNFMISEKSWQKLSDNDKKVFQEVVNKYVMISIDNAEKEDAKYMDLMRKKGIKVFTYTEKELQPIQEANVASWPKLAESSLTKELMDEFTANIVKKK